MFLTAQRETRPRSRYIRPGAAVNTIARGLTPSLIDPCRLLEKHSLFFKPPGRTYHARVRAGRMLVSHQKIKTVAHRALSNTPTQIERQTQTPVPLLFPAAAGRSGRTALIVPMNRITPRRTNHTLNAQRDSRRQ